MNYGEGTTTGVLRITGVGGSSQATALWAFRRQPLNPGGGVPETQPEPRVFVCSDKSVVVMGSADFINTSFISAGDRHRIIGVAYNDEQSSMFSRSFKVEQS